MIFEILDLQHLKDQKKLTKQHLNPYKPFLGSSSPTLIGLLYKLGNKNKVNLWQTLNPLQHLGFCTVDKITQPALAALFVNGLSPEISGLIKIQKTGWEATGLTELMTIAEHSGRTLEQDHKQ